MLDSLLTCALWNVSYKCKNTSAQKVLHPLHSGVNWPIWKHLEFQAFVTVPVQAVPPVVSSQKQFIAMCFWGMSTKICAACTLSRRRRSELVWVWVHVCVCACSCISSVSAQHSPHSLSPPQPLWTAKCHADIPLISLKNGLSECNSCCTFAPYLDLCWLFKSVLVLLLNFIISYFKVLFHALGYLVFNCITCLVPTSVLLL